MIDSKFIWRVLAEEKVCKTCKKRIRNNFVVLIKGDKYEFYHKKCNTKK